MTTRRWIAKEFSWSDITSFMPKGENNRKLTDAQRLELAASYLTPLPDGTWRGAKTLARDFGITPTAVYYNLGKLGVQTRNSRTAFSNGKRCRPIRNLPVGEAPKCRCGCGTPTEWNRRMNRWNRYVRGHYRREASYKDRGWLMREYVDNRRAISDLAAECGVGRSSVRKQMEKHGIPVRSGRDAHMGRQAGSRNPAWKGGVAKWAYSHDWKHLARVVRDRDAWTCQDCGEQRDRWGNALHVHHIDGDKLNNALENLISLCAACHRQRHR